MLKSVKYLNMGRWGQLISVYDAIEMGNIFNDLAIFTCRVLGWVCFVCFSMETSSKYHLLIFVFFFSLASNLGSNHITACILFLLNQVHHTTKTLHSNWASNFPRNKPNWIIYEFQADLLQIALFNTHPDMCTITYGLKIRNTHP